MNKHYNMLTMLSLLQQHKIIKINTFMSVLKVSNKQVRRYRDELLTFDIRILSTTGKDGGYTLIDRDDQLLDNIYSDELNKLIKLLSRLDRDISVTYNALLSYLKNNLNETVSLYNMESETLFSLIVIHSSIKTKMSVRADIVVDDKTVKISIDPYLVYRKYDAWYIYGHNDYPKLSIHLRIDSFKNIEATNNTFKIPISQVNTTKNILSSKVGIFIEEKKHKVILQSNALSQEHIEHIFECDVEENDNGYVFNSYNLGITKSKVLSLGDSVYVKEPKELVMMLKNDVKVLERMYIK